MIERHSAGVEPPLEIVTSPVGEFGASGSGTLALLLFLRIAMNASKSAATNKTSNPPPTPIPMYNAFSAALVESSDWISCMNYQPDAFKRQCAT